MADKSIPQLTAQTSSIAGDLFHIVRSSVDYKIEYTNLASSIRGGTTADTIYYASLTITSAQVLALFTTPLLLIAAPAVGTHIHIIKSSCKVTFNTIAYATNMNVDVYTDTATVVQERMSSVLNASTTRTSQGQPQVVSAAAEIQLIQGKAVYVKVPTGNPTAGNSDIKIFVSYKLVTE